MHGKGRIGVFISRSLLCNVEVCQVDLTVLRNQDVTGLDISVADPTLVEVLDAFKDLLVDPPGLLFVVLTHGCDLIKDFAPFN